MIQHLDTEELSGLHQACRQRPVLGTGLRIATGMVVGTQDRGRIGEQRRLEYFTRMHHGRGETPHRNSIDADPCIFAVEEHYNEVLAVVVSLTAADNSDRSKTG